LYQQLHDNLLGNYVLVHEYADQLNALAKILVTFLQGSEFVDHFALPKGFEERQLYKLTLVDDSTTFQPAPLPQIPEPGFKSAVWYQTRGTLDLEWDELGPTKLVFTNSFFGL
jgi:hypothetical protein